MTTSIIETKEGFISALKSKKNDLTPCIKVFVHDGIMHADEAFACGLLTTFFGSTKFEFERRRFYTKEDFLLARPNEVLPIMFIDELEGPWDHHNSRQEDCKFLDGTYKASVALIWDLINSIYDDNELSIFNKDLINLINLKIKSKIFSIVYDVSQTDTTGKITGMVSEIFSALCRQFKWVENDNFTSAIGIAEDFIKSCFKTVTNEIPIYTHPISIPDGPFKKRFLFCEKAIEISSGITWESLESIPKQDFNFFINTVIDYENSCQEKFNELIKGLRSLPVTTINGFKFLQSEEFIQISDLRLMSDFINDGIVGIVNPKQNPKTKEFTGTWQFRCFNDYGEKITIKGLRNNNGVVFTHISGFTGEVENFDDLHKCFVIKY